MVKSNASGRCTSAKDKRALQYGKARGRLLELYFELGSWRGVSTRLYGNEKQNGNLSLIAKNHKNPSKGLLILLGIQKKRIRNDIRWNLTLQDAESILTVLKENTNPKLALDRLEILINKKKRLIDG